MEDDRVVFEIYAPAFLLDQIQIRKVRLAVLVEIYPDFGPVDVSCPDADIATELPRVQIVNGEAEPGVLDEEEFFAGYAIVERCVDEMKLERGDRQRKFIGRKHDADVGHLFRE